LPILRRARLHGAGTVSAAAGCNNDTARNRVGRSSGALVGGLASPQSGRRGGRRCRRRPDRNSIGHSNNRADCRSAARAREYRRERDSYYIDRQERPVTTT